MRLASTGGTTPKEMDHERSNSSCRTKLIERSRIASGTTKSVSSVRFRALVVP
jgi:hypothetical protein